MDRRRALHQHKQQRTHVQSTKAKYKRAHVGYGGTIDKSSALACKSKSSKWHSSSEKTICIFAILRAAAAKACKRNQAHELSKLVLLKKKLSHSTKTQKW